MKVFDKLFKKEPTKAEIVMDKLLDEIETLDKGSDKRKNEAETYKIIKTAETEAKKAKQAWTGTVIKGVGLAAIFGVSIIQYLAPFKAAEKDIYITNKIDVDAQRDAKGSMKDVARNMLKF